MARARWAARSTTSTPTNPSTTKFPEYWDDKAFFAEFSQDYLAVFDVQWPNGPVDHITHFLPNAALETNGQAITDSPIDIEFGPDGSLYVLDYGDGFFRANPDAGLYRIDYSPGNKAPTARISADPISSSGVPLTVDFDGSDSTDPEGGALTYEWDFTGDGTFDATGVDGDPHLHHARVSTPCACGSPTRRAGSASRARTISVGNVAPTVNVSTPNGGFFDWGQAVPFVGHDRPTPRTGPPPCAPASSWTFGLGHDAHAHPLSQGTGCQFAIPTPADATAARRDREHLRRRRHHATPTPAPTASPAATTSERSLILNPKPQEAEWADVVQGVELTADDTASGLRKVTSLDPGDHLAWDPVNLAGITGVTVRSSGSGTLALRWNAPDATPFATVAVIEQRLVRHDGEPRERPDGDRRPVRHVLRRCRPRQAHLRGQWRRRRHASDRRRRADAGRAER